MKKDVFKALVFINQIGFLTIATFLICFWIGRWLNNIFDKEIFIPIFLVLAILSSMRNLYVYAMGVLDDKGKKK